MTWEELRQKAKEIGAEVFYTSIYFDGIKFTKSGKVIMAFVGYKKDFLFAEDRTPDQMLAIMKALQ